MAPYSDNPVGSLQSPGAQKGGVPGSSGEPDLSFITDILNDPDASQAARDEESRQDAVLTKLKTDFYYFKIARAGRYETRWNEFYRLYRVQYPDERKTGEWRSKITKPYAFNSVEDVLPHYMDGIFGGEQLFNLASNTESEEMLEAHEKLLDYQLKDQIGIEEAYEEYLRQCLLFGTTFAYVGWRETYAERKMWTKEVNLVDPGQSAPVLKTFTVPDYVGNTFDVIDIWNIYLHPRATRKNYRMIFWEEWRTMDWIKAHKEFKNVDKITQGMVELANNQSRAEFKQYETGSGNSQTTQTIEETYRVVYCFDEDLKKYYCYVADSVLLCEEDYPYFHGQCPIVSTVYTPMTNEFYGLGILEQSANLIHMGNTLLNASMDNLQMSMQHMWEVRDGSVVDEKEEFKWRPFGIIHTETGQDLHPLEHPLFPQDLWTREKDIADSINRNAGSGGALAGQPTNATGGTAIQMNQKGQLMRLEYAIRKAAKGLAKMVNQMFENNMQFYPVDSVKAVLGPRLFANWETFQPDMIQVTARVIVEPVGLFKNEEVLRQQFTNALNVFGANPLMANELDWKYLTKKGLKLFMEQDPDLALKKHGTIDEMEYEFARQENLAIVNGEYVPPATPQDDEDIHEQVHMSLGAARPDLMQGALGQHLLSHNQAVMQRQQMMLQAQLGQAPGGGPVGGQGQGSAPSGSRGGGVNPARQPTTTGPESIVRQAGRTAGRK